MWDIMKKTYAILVAVIFLISVSAVFAADSSKEIFLGGVKFSVPSNGEFTPDNTGYHTDKFGIDLIQDNSLPDEQNTIKNSSLTKMTLYHRDVLAIYSKSSDDFNVFYFSAGDKLFKASCKEDSDIKKLQDIVKNSPNSTLTTEEFYARLVLCSIIGISAFIFSIAHMPETWKLFRRQILISYTYYFFKFLRKL